MDTSTKPKVTDATIAVHVGMSSPGVWKRVGKDEIDGAIASSDTGAHVDVDARAMRASKRLFDLESFKAIVKVDCDTRAWFKARALPSFFKAGIFLLPVKLAANCAAFMTEQSARRSEAVDAFVAEYAAYIAAGGDPSLRSLYNVSDYPTPEAMRAAFGIEWGFVTFDTPTELRSIDAALFEQEREKAEQRWRAVGDEVERLLLTNLHAIVSRLSDRLATRDDGKPTIFRNTVLDGLNEFLEFADLRNVTSHGELTALTGRLRSMMSGLTPQALRDGETLRADIKAQLDDVAGSIGNALEAAPGRKMLVTMEMQDA